jgi:hypothetical protein
VARNWGTTDLAATGRDAEGRLLPKLVPREGPGAEAVAQGLAVPAPPPPPSAGRPNKYGARRTLGPAPWGGQVAYASAAEAGVARNHELEKSAGLIRAWAIQVSIPIGLGPRGFRRHVVDFLALLDDGRLRIRECKGYDHGAGRQKRLDLEALNFVVEMVER